jgi:glycosyltransferase involved in cell wall biosynthesis
VDPLGKSQILPYILGLAEAGFKFTILSFEKTDRDPLLIRELARQLRAKNISWVHLPFVRGRFQGVLRMLQGAKVVRQIASREPFAMAHMRTILPAVIYKLAFVGRPFVYDIRAFSGQWVDGGRLSNRSIAYRFLGWLEDRLIRGAAGLVVLDQSGADYLRKIYRRLPPIKVIPTSTDLSFSPPGQVAIKAQPSAQVRFVFLGGARFPYLPVEALQFVQALLAQGCDCSVDFINERDHAFVEQACQRIDFPRDRFRLFSLPQEDVCARLFSYHCGLVFIADGPWIRMSSPTKIGEYLAAGLHVVGLRGIAALDRLAAQSSCVDVLARYEQGCQLSSQQAAELVARIQAPSRPAEARRLAEQHYDRAKAVTEYVDLYQQVLSGS